MPSSTNVLDEAAQLVEKRLADLDEERKRLERALAELGGKAVRRALRAARAAAPARNRKRAAAARKRRNAAAAPAPTRPSNLIDEQPGHQRLRRRQDDENQTELPLPGAR